MNFTAIKDLAQRYEKDMTKFLRRACQNSGRKLRRKGPH